MDTELQKILTESWQQITAGSREPGHAFRNITVAHHGDTYVNAYTVVLRDVAVAHNQITFYTDYRSPKVQQIEQYKHVTICVYDAVNKLQLILKGDAVIQYQSDVALAYWQKEGRKSRKSYLAQPSPSTPVDEATDGLTHLKEKQINEDAPDGYENFAVVQIHIRQLEYLKLSHEGNQRAQFTRQSDNNWQGTWLIP